MTGLLIVLVFGVACIVFARAAVELTCRWIDADLRAGSGRKLGSWN